MPADLLFEIGCEEIPAKMLARQLADLPALVEKRLADLRLAHKGVRALGTPRRLAFIVRQLADRQPDVNEEVVGPPVGAAFAPDGSVTKAGQGFALKNNVDPSTLQKKEVPGKKGQYAVAVRSLVGQETRGLLPKLLADLVPSIHWPKSQRWGWGETTFVRPLQWLVALYGGEVVPVQWANLTATRNSRGHRFLAPGPVEISSPDRYIEALKQANVVVDPEVRRIAVQAELSRLEKETGLRVRPDDALLEEVIHLGEYPVGVSGQFDPSYLEVPEEVIVTAMRTHQRYFAMESSDGKLANRFATMMATIVKDPAVVARGNEKVLAARLADAKFFFAEDRKRTFEEWNEKLDKVVFQAKLGDKAKTIGQKVRRITALVEALGGNDTARRAAQLCKADLASSAVGEFPELQGTMGRHYARHANEPDAVAVAIEQHWWPKGQGGTPPETTEAALVAIADRMDTLVGCFATGLIPSGNADPLGLRRAAIAVIAIMLDRGKGGPHSTPGFPHSIGLLVDRTVANYGDTLPVDAKAREELRSFFRDRQRAMLIGEGFPANTVEAVLKVSEIPSDVRGRAKAVAVVSEATREVFKRIANLVDQGRDKGFSVAAEVDTRQFEDPVESQLWNAWLVQEPQIRDSGSRGDWDAFFKCLADLGQAVAAYLGDRAGTGVMVLDPKNRELASNRLGVLSSIIEPYEAVIDLRKLGGAS